MLFVIIICESVGRMRDRSAFMLVWVAVVVSAVPVVYSLILLTMHNLSTQQ